MAVRLKRPVALFALFALLAVAAATARAQPYTWDPGLTNSANGGGAGTWDVTTANWFNGTADVVWPGAGNVAVFGGAAGGVVSVAAGGISADGLTFNTTGYTVGGTGTLTLTGTAPTVAVGSGLTATVNAVVAGTAGLTLTGGETLALAGANTYTGTTTVLTGTIQANNASALGAATNGLQLGDTAGTLTTAANVTFTSSATVGSFLATTQTSGTTVDTVTVPTGQTLTVNGAVSIGVAASATANTTTTSVAMTGGGGLNIAAGAAAFNVVVSSNNNNFGAQTATLDLGGLSSFTFTGTGNFNVGFGARIIATLNLANTGAATNSITAGTINIGNTNNLNNSGTSTLNLGGGTNTLNADTINIGRGKSPGVLQFVAGAPATASLTVAGSAGGASTSNITVGNASSATWGGGTARLLLAGRPVTVQGGTVTVGQMSGTTGGTSATADIGQATFDTGTFTVNTLNIVSESSGNASPNGIGGSFTLGASAASTGTLTVNTAFNLGNITSTTTTSHTSRAAFTINGGTATVNADLNSVNSNPNATVVLTSALTLAGGTLNMTGHQIGHAAGNTRNITTVTMPAAGQTATIANLGGTGINDAGVTMNGAGTLILSGTNTYTGATTVTGGTLVVSGSLASPIAVAAGSTLSGTGPINAAVTVAGTVAPGSSIGALAVGPMTWSPGGSYQFEHKADPSTFAGGPTTPTAGTDNDTITGTGTLDLSTLAAGNTFGINLVPINFPATTPGAPVTYTLGTFAGGVNGSGGAIAPGTNISNLFAFTGSFSTTPVVTVGNGGVVTIGFTPVPEPAHVLLACSAAAAAWRVRRRTTTRS